MFEVCSQHRNRIERICLHPDCRERALCLLCDHPHGNPFQSIMVKQSESYKTFEANINMAIDRYFIEKEESSQQKIKMEQAKQISSYFKELKHQVDLFLVECEKNAIGKLQSKEQEDFLAIRRARIDRNYVSLDPRIFSVLMQVYEGSTFREIFASDESGRSEEAQQLIQQLHKQIGEMMTGHQSKLRIKIPDIRSVKLPSSEVAVIQEQNYDMEDAKPVFEAQCIRQSQCEIDTMISDCQRGPKCLLVTSYDKKLRAFNESLNLLGEQEYLNVLTRLHPIAQDIYALACSKEILIENITLQDQQLKCENVMKLRGHTQRIMDLHSLNSRVLGSASTEGVKLWDLYKEKCQYTLKEESSPTAMRFLGNSGNLAVAFDNHQLKIYAVQSMRLVRKYALPSMPLMIDPGKFPQTSFYVGGFSSHLWIIDSRLPKPTFQFNFGCDAVTCVVDSCYDQYAVAVGDRGGSCSLLDMRTKRKRLSWSAHVPAFNRSKPRGVVAIFEERDSEWTTVGCNDRILKTWQIVDTKNPQ